VKPVAETVGEPRGDLGILVVDPVGPGVESEISGREGSAVAADPIRSLENDGVETAFAGSRSGGETGGTAAEDRDVSRRRHETMKVLLQKVRVNDNRTGVGYSS